jgi:hypothetical protein
MRFEPTSNSTRCGRAMASLELPVAGGAAVATPHHIAVWRERGSPNRAIAVPSMGAARSGVRMASASGVMARPSGRAHPWASRVGVAIDHGRMTCRAGWA